MLDAGAGVEIYVFFNLALAQTGGGLVDGHLDDVVGGGHDDAVEGGVGGADLRIVDGPEAVEGEAFFVVFAGRLHGAPVLVADAVVDGFEGDGGEECVEGIEFG